MMIIHSNTAVTVPAMFGPNGLIDLAVVAMSLVPELVEVVQLLWIVDVIFMCSRRTLSSLRH